MCPNGTMGSDFSALDAELDQVGAGPEVDAVALANQYAGDLQVSLARGAPGEELAAVDSALAELGAKVEPVEAHGSEQAPAARGSARAHAAGPRDAAREPALAAATTGSELADDTEAFLRDAPSGEVRDAPSYEAGDEPSYEAGDEPPASLVPPPSSVLPPSSAPGPGPLESEEIALPEPVVRPRSDEASQELPLDLAPRSGSFALDDEGAQASGRDLVPAATSEPPAPTTMPAPTLPDEDEEGERAFAALFDEVTKQSSIPSPSASAELPDIEDTEIFDSAAFARALQGSRDPLDLQDEVELSVEDLDSAEFEVMTETAVAQPSPPSSTPPRPSQPSEKRPSFLGRLFGRKEE